MRVRVPVKLHIPLPDKLIRRPLRSGVVSWLLSTATAAWLISTSLVSTSVCGCCSVTLFHVLFLAGVEADNCKSQNGQYNLFHDFIIWLINNRKGTKKNLLSNNFL